MAWTTNYYHCDAVGSTRALTDSTQAVTDSYEYDAFGNEQASSGETVNPFRYVGEMGYYYDVDSGNTYVRERLYDPRIIRWLSVDPIGFDASDCNLYRYVKNRSTIVVDYRGLDDAVIAINPATNPAQTTANRGREHVCVDETKGLCVDMAEYYARQAAAKKAREREITDYINAFSIGEARQGLKDMNKCFGCINTLYIYGHGIPGGQFIGPRRMRNPVHPQPSYLISILTAGNAARLFNGISFCQPCTIKLQGCSVGKGPKGDLLLKAIRKETRCSVVAFDHQATIGPDGTCWETPGTIDPWVPNPDPRPKILPYE